jgi:hypothetical protein
LTVLLLPSRPSKFSIPFFSLLLDETDVAEEAVVLREGVLDEADGTEDEEAVDGLSNLLIAGSREAPAVASLFSSPALASPAAPARSASYLAHSRSVVARSRGFLLSKLADRLSKQ